MKIPNGEKTIHAALLCTGCAIPAGNLPYYDAIRMSTIVDPLHNLYIGTAKHVLKDVWVDRKFLVVIPLNLCRRK